MTAELTWTQALEAFERQRQETRTLAFDVPGGEIRFVIRALTQLEKDQLEAKALRGRSRNRGGAIGPDEIRTVKVETIKAGIVEGPAGFQPTAENIAALPAHVRDGLADAIGTFHELDEETQRSFRVVGAGAGDRAD
ncbi:MAG: hypothetical protein QMD46_12295 [Methanomicrobiales archaeon]|nr:hypothetical protein [Methanomicrobiales archaeon]MDI6877569.1 hypothetical protein [Methanomicrobiales archaeon]